MKNGAVRGEVLGSRWPGSVKLSRLQVHGGVCVRLNGSEPVQQAQNQ
jgi:hypothetical protein